jgi:uncharacterized protein YjdB
MRTFIRAVAGLILSVAACSTYGTSVVAVDNNTVAKVASVSVSVPASLVTGQTGRATAIPKDANGAALTNRVVLWYTSSASIASVTDSGVISAVAPGSAVVSAVSEGISGQATVSIAPPKPTPIATVSVAVNPSTVQVGQTAHAVATLKDSTGNALSGRTIVWASSNASIATVDATGLVTGVAAGSSTITATSEGKSNASGVTVSAAAPVPVASVVVSPSPVSVQVGGTAQMSAVTNDANGNPLSGRAVSWASSNTGVATVSPTGVVSGVAAGTAQITATSEGKSGSSSATVSAAAPVPVGSVSVSPASTTLNIGGTKQLSATTRDANNNVLTGRVISWSSANSSIASVDPNSGLVTAAAVGSTQITATSEGKSGSASITVQTPPPPPPPGSSNEPPGMTVITERAFNSKTEDPKWDNYNAGPLTIEQDPTAPKSPSSVIRSTLPAGFQAGSSNGSTGIQFSSVSTLYVSYWAKYSDNWQGQQADINKQAYAWVSEGGGDGKFVMEASGVGSGTMRPRPILQSMIVGDGHKDPNLIPTQEIVRGQWFHIEIVLNPNTAGNADGSFDVWQDGQHCTHYEGLQWTNGDTRWFIFEIQPIWGGTGGTVTNTMYIQYDHIYISGKG